MAVNNKSEQFDALKTSQAYIAASNSRKILTLKTQALELLEDVLFSLGEAQTSRFIQDLPIRLNVWRKFAENPTQQIKMIITPNYLVSAREALMTIRRETFIGQEKSQLMALPNSILISADINQTFFLLLRQTYWWQKYHSRTMKQWTSLLDSKKTPRSLSAIIAEMFQLEGSELVRLIAVWSIILSAEKNCLDHFSDDAKPEDLEELRWSTIKRFSSVILALGTQGIISKRETSLAAHFKQLGLDVDRIGLFFSNFFELVSKFAKGGPLNDHDKSSSHKSAPIWSIDMNRKVHLAVNTSRKTIKADAAERLFDEDTSKLTWAIIDSGVDAAHIGFTDRAIDDPVACEFLPSRVRETYDFTRLLALFNQDYTSLVNANTLRSIKRELSKNKKRNASIASIDEAIIAHLFKENWSSTPKILSSVSTFEALKSDEDFRQQVLDYIEDVKRLIVSGLLIDWVLLEPLIKVSHRKGEYISPVDPHGTHVAGILGGDIRKAELSESNDSKLKGVCPDISLMDFRVCDDNGMGEEFLVLAALQFASFCNRSRDVPLINGVNLSLSIHHEIRNYACGQTPVCREANKLVSEGLVVVAAAGNTGFQRVNAAIGELDRYHSVSITDPGNAANVITVGSIYRKEPHTYGVSYFSSRGPTGDGRQKPDLVAPGERISSLIPNNEIASKDGTSMSAPHVSGAAAILMSRHTELVGDPLKIKKILCDTATDIGRVKEFQGAGVVDVLRALQSI